VVGADDFFPFDPAEGDGASPVDAEVVKRPDFSPQPTNGDPLVQKGGCQGLAVLSVLQ
jgi:hypothetical protein